MQKVRGNESFIGMEFILIQSPIVDHSPNIHTYTHHTKTPPPPYPPSNSLYKITGWGCVVGDYFDIFNDVSVT